ncbi:MAG: CgeB family protein [Acidimicrobiales bacterium]
MRTPAGYQRWKAYRRASGAWQRSRLEHHYLARRERYAAEARQRGLSYREGQVCGAIGARLGARGYTPPVRPMGKVHTFAFIPRISWHCALYSDLHELGPVTEFDYVKSGHQIEDLRGVDDKAGARRDDINSRMLSALRAAHNRRPVDWLFAYANGWEIQADAIREVVEELGIPTVNMCLDDKQSWTGPWLGKQRAGQIDIGPAFDVSWTSARVACEWYLVEGARPIYLPEGFDMHTFRPMPLERDIPVSFVGADYGFRPDVIEHLKDCGIPVRAFGPGWGAGSVTGDDQVAVFNRSRINLGMGGIGCSEDLTNVKTRDFEVPGTGGGVYLTSFNADLAQHFEIGQEVVCYGNRAELIELARYYLGRPEEADDIAQRGRERCLAQHRWLHRYQRILAILGVLKDSAGSRPSAVM